LVLGADSARKSSTSWDFILSERPLLRVELYLATRPQTGPQNGFGLPTFFLVFFFGHIDALINYSSASLPLGVFGVGLGFRRLGTVAAAAAAWCLPLPLPPLLLPSLPPPLEPRAVAISSLHRGKSRTSSTS
jgi:hypothetical protein